MKTSILATTIVACALSAPIVSAQDKSAPTGPANSVDMDKQMSQMQENMKVMQKQMEKLRRQSQLQENMNEMQRQMEDSRRR
jgi:TolA-binding protein